jgi:glycosyltransferase involved in cell wall biosynthesis
MRDFQTPMRIGLITGEYPPMHGGVGAFTHELGTALVDLGHEIHIITRVGCEEDKRLLAGTNDEGSVSSASRFTVHAIVPNWGWRSYRQIMHLASYLDLEVLNIQYQAAAYDLRPAINFLPWCARFSSVIRRRLTAGRRHRVIVVTFHDLNAPYLFPKAGSVRDWVVILLAQQADAAIVTNRADELALTARGIGRVERIPIGSNITPALPADYDRDAWRARVGVTPNDFLLGFFGFFNARKGVETLIRALAALDQFHHLLFIGGTVGSSDPTNRAYADRMTALINGLGLSDRVHFTGYVATAKVSAAFAAVDLCVLPYADGISFHHGTLLAALSHSQPIISTRPLIELPELVHGENVWLVLPEDPEALAAAITTLAADTECRQRLSHGAAALSAQFSWECIAASTVELMEGLQRET